jgi:hypothetical protein
MGHPEIVMQRSQRGQKRTRVTTTLHFTIAVLEIRLRPRASFQEKLRQLLGKCTA